MQKMITFAAMLLACSALTAPAALVAEYNFSGNAIDSSGNALNGTNIGAALTADRFGNANSAFDFNGSAHIEVPYNPLLNATTGEWSMSAWIKSTQGGWILGMGGDFATPGPYFSYGLGAHPPDPLSSLTLVTVAWGCAGCGHMVASTDPAPALDGAWHHVAGTIKNNVIAKLYLDGALVATDDPADAGGPWNINVMQQFWIGDVQNSSRDAFIGVIDDVKLYNHVLSDSEVAALYAVPEPSALVISMAAIAVGIHARRRFARV